MMMMMLGVHSGRPLLTSSPAGIPDALQVMAQSKARVQGKDFQKRVEQKMKDQRGNVSSTKKHGKKVRIMI